MGSSNFEEAECHVGYSTSEYTGIERWLAAPYFRKQLLNGRFQPNSAIARGGVRLGGANHTSAKRFITSKRNCMN